MADEKTNREEGFKRKNKRLKITITILVIVVVLMLSSRITSDKQLSEKNGLFDELCQDKGYDKFTSFEETNVGTIVQCEKMIYEI